eukprot:6128103-Pleurochrysis_carterae.AAC.2
MSSVVKAVCSYSSSLGYHTLCVGASAAGVAQSTPVSCQQAPLPLEKLKLQPVVLFAATPQRPNAKTKLQLRLPLHRAGGRARSRAGARWPSLRTAAGGGCAAAVIS